MNIRIAILLFLAASTTVRADDKIASVQQTLKDQGFYYGDITGEKNADTTAAIRRYQIRNGLQINGELNEETLKALRSASASAPTSSPPPAQVTTRPPSPAPDITDSRDDFSRTDDETEAPAPRSIPAEPEGRQPPPVYPGAVAPGPFTGETFGRTPFENAPPEIKRQVIIDAQRQLARHGLYRGELTGFLGPETEFSLRAYQSRVGLAPTGRLDLETLAALELLPGAHEPVYTPRRIYREPPVRGEWIRP